MDKLEERTQGGGTPSLSSAEAKEISAQAKRTAGGRRAFLVLGGIVGALLLGIGGYAFATRGQETTDDAQVEADVVPIAMRVQGQVAKVLVKDNQLVKAGQPLLEIDSSDYAARAQQAEAELQSARAQLQAAQAQAEVAEAAARGGFDTAKAAVSSSSVGVASANAQVESARAALERARADVRRTELDLERTQKLFELQAVTQERLDNAQIAHQVAEAALAQAQAGLAAAEEARRAAHSRVAESKGRLTQTQPIDAQIKAARAQASLAEARVKAAEAAVTLAQNQLSYTRVVAPADGVVSRLSVNEGQLVNPGQPVAELVPSERYVVANFKETQLGGIRPGQDVDVEVDAFPGTRLHARVLSLSAGTGARFSLLPPDNASGNFVKVVQRVPVKIALVDLPKDLPLRAGLSAEVTVHVNQRSSPRLRPRSLR